MKYFHLEFIDLSYKPLQTVSSWLVLLCKYESHGSRVSLVSYSSLPPAPAWRPCVEITSCQLTQEWCLHTCSQIACHQMLSQEKSTPPHQDNAPGFRSRCTIPLEWRYTSRIGPDWWSHWINLTNQLDQHGPACPSPSKITYFKPWTNWNPIPWGPQRCCSRSASKSLESPIWWLCHAKTSRNFKLNIWNSGITTKRKWMKWLVGTVQCMFHDVSNNQTHWKKVHKASWMFIGMSKNRTSNLRFTEKPGSKASSSETIVDLGFSVQAKPTSTTQREKRQSLWTYPPKKKVIENSNCLKKTRDFLRLEWILDSPFFWGAPFHCSLQWS